MSERRVRDRVVLAGASGFIGDYLTAAYRSRGAEVTRIGRRGPDARWGNTAAITDALDGADVLINLAGKSVNCRYNEANRAEIIRSRVATTSELARAIAACDEPPPVWLNSSTATIYRHAEDRPMTESTGELGTGFSVGVATAWEEALFAADLPATRRVALRMAIVLGDGSALVPLLRLARLGLGGPQLDGHWFATEERRRNGIFHEFRDTDGRQKFSWVHIADVLGAIDFLRVHPELAGPVNITSPNPSDGRTLMRTIRELLGVPIGIPSPRWLLEIGAKVISTETELILKSRWVVPERLLAAGYSFQYPELEPALRQIIDQRRSASPAA